MPKPTPRYGPALLVVEDDALVRLSLVDVLTDDGFDVLDAEDAIQALDLICTRPERLQHHSGPSCQNRCWYATGPAKIARGLLQCRLKSA